MSTCSLHIHAMLSKYCEEIRSGQFLICIWSYPFERSMRLTPVLVPHSRVVKLSYNVQTNSILDRLCSFSPWAIALPGTQFDCERTEMWGFLSKTQRTGITSCILLIHRLCLRFGTAVSLGRSGYYLLLLVSEGHGCDNVKTKTW